jgi:hypothetical protein
MTKKIMVILAMLVALISGANAGNYVIPSGYQYIKSVGNGAIKVYKKNGVYVSIIDLGRAKLNVGNVQAAGNNKFVKYTLSEWWNNISNKLAIYNGQFFSMNGWPYASTTTLSFPLRSYWNNINTSIDTGSLKTLRVNSWGYTTIHYGYSSSMLNNSKELIVGFNPNQNKGYSKSTGRFYIAGIPFNKSETREYYRTMEYLLFFTAISKNQSQMYSEISQWNAMQRDIVMMDGSGSAQMKVGSLEVYADGFPRKREIPNVISIESR